MTLQLSFEASPHPDDIQILGDGIMIYAQEKKGLNPLDFFAFFIRDKDKMIVGGCNGNTLYGCLYIDQLWISDVIRHKGWGTKLMNAALNYGKKQGCTFATVNTMDWEALGFYQKLGFKLEFERRGFQKGSVFYFLRKEFSELAVETESRGRVKIRPFVEQDIPHLVDKFAYHHWHKSRSTFELYLHEQMRGERCIWLAFHNEQQFAGYVTLRWTSDYEPFSKNQIPEIMDLNVLPPYRKQGIGSCLLNTAEREAAIRGDEVGLGVGLYQDYGNAQKLYIKKGYCPNGHGVTYRYKPVRPGSNASVDDDLVLWFTKKLRSSTQQSFVREEAVSIKNASHFKWGQDCDGWWLKSNGHFTLIYETMPAGSYEKKHYHNKTEQFFYCLQGELVVEFDDYEQNLQEYEGISIKPGVSHKAKNISANPVCFLVVSSPNLPEDRVNQEVSKTSCL